jgi:DivIVA domain-containing protein
MPDIKTIPTEIPVMMRGYDTREVDELFGRIEATLRSGAHQVTAEKVRRTHFTVVMRGYDPDTVDDTLLRYVGELERRERHSSGQWRVLRTAT